MGPLLDRPADRTPPERVRHRFVTLDDGYLRELAEVVDRDPIVNAVVAARVQAVGRLEPSRLGGMVFGALTVDGAVSAAVFAGALLLPIGGEPDSWAVLAEGLRQRPRPCTSMVGRADAIHAMWRHVEPAWGPARVVRPRQHLTVLDTGRHLPTGDPRVRQVRADELDVYLPAAAAMFTEELDISPYAIGSVGDYRRRTAALIDAGRAFAVIDEHGVLFKADLGAVSTHTCQIQGVWVRPDARGHGVGTAALPAVLRHALTLAPTVSLYVNDFNDVARRMYAGLGMREVAVLSTVLF